MTSCCRSCGEDDIADHKVPFFELLHNGASVEEDAAHLVCVECFGLLQASRGCRPSFDCPSDGCNRMIVGHCCWKKTKKITRRTTVISQTVERQAPVYITEPSKLEDPVRHFMQQPSAFQLKHILLSCQYVDSIGDIKSLITLVDVTEPCGSYTDVVQDQLVAFMVMLNQVFFVPISTEGNDRLVLETPNDIENFVLNDRSLLTRAVIAFASGNTIDELLPKGLASNPYHKSNFLAFWVAIEMMRRGTRIRPGVLQDFIQHHLTLHQVPQDVKNLLTKFRIAASRNRMRLQDIDKVNAKITTGWDLEEKRHWMCYMLYDNLGFRKRGARAGYDQYTMLLNHMISPEDLMKVGFYLPPGSPQAPICRIRKDWATQRLSVDKRDVLPGSNEYAALGVQLYSHIDALLSVCNKLPTLEAARDLLASYNRNDLFFVADTRISTSYGSTFRSKLDPEATITDVEVVEEENDPTDIEDDIEIDNPCLDPAATRTMYDLDDQQIEIETPFGCSLP